METETSKQTEEPTAPRSLREELMQDLTSKFVAELESDESLPSAVREALAEILNAEAPIATEIVAALSKNDPVEEEGADE